ncbi:MAG: type II/IV secretion system ATPase subunit [Candidatus Aenigmatarchaeota archaeon]
MPYLKTSYGMKRIRIKKDIAAPVSESEESVGEIEKDITKEKPMQGIMIPDIKTEKLAETTPGELKNINLKYPLMVDKDRVYAYAHITWDPRTNEVVYNVIEPTIDTKLKNLLEEIKLYIQEKIDIDFAHIKNVEASEYLNKIFDKTLNLFKVKPDLRDTLKYYIMRDFIGLESIEPFLKDKFIEDISCDGVAIPIYVYHRNPKFGSIRTNVSFSSTEELDSFVNKLAERCGKTISIAKPLLDGTLPDGSRIQATLGSDIARQGSNFTIRMFTEEPLTPTDIIKFGTCDIKMMAYLWFLIEHGKSVLISGGTATGKTSLLNVLSLFIKPQMKIISIEDTAELRLPHPHWVPEIARASISENGAVDMFELLRESLRQRPDYIVVGEVRGREAYVLFQQMAVGHPGLSTIHAENFQKLIDRLTTPPISLSANLIENLDVILFLKRVKRGNKYMRRVFSIYEIMGFDRKSNEPIVNEVMTWSAARDEFLTMTKSALLKKISENTGLTADEIQDDLRKKADVIRWMVDKKIKDYRKVAKVLNLFYTSGEYLLGKIRA